MNLTPAGLRTFREALGMTQEQLAQRLGVRGNTVARWERGELTIEHAPMLTLALLRLSDESAQQHAPQERQQDEQERAE